MNTHQAKLIIKENGLERTFIGNQTEEQIGAMLANIQITTQKFYIGDYIIKGIYYHLYDCAEKPRPEKFIQLFRKFSDCIAPIPPTIENYTKLSSIDKAKQLIYGDRNKQYGDAKENFTIVSNFWNIYLAEKLQAGISPKDVAIMMTLFKIARQMQNEKDDNIIDAIGYLGLTDQLNESEGELPI
jgi:hypothetical protein